jgi:spore maturation protein CgeB
MRILLAGVFDRKHGMSGVLRARVLTQLGHEVDTLDYRGVASPWTRRWARVIARHRAETALLAKARNGFDLIIVLKGELFSPAAIRRVRATIGIPVVNWWPDDPHLLHISRTLAPAYDLFFTHDTYAVAVMRAEGTTGARYLPFGCDPATHHPYPLDGAGDEQFRVDVAMVGVHDPVREQVLRSLAGLGVHVWGPGWRGRKVPGIVTHDAVYGVEMFKVLSNAKIGLNIHQNFGRDVPAYGHGANSRVFEVTACGGLLLSDRKLDLRNLFEEDREIACYASLPELRRKAEELLADEGVRNRMRAAAQHRAVTEHTLHRRFVELLAEVEARGRAGSVPF